MLHTVFVDLQKKFFWMKDVIILFPCHFTITFRVQISILKSNLFNTLSVCSIKIYNDAIWTSDWIHLVDLCMLSSFQFSPLSSPNWCFNSEKLANVFGIGIFQMLLSVGLSDTALECLMYVSSVHDLVFDQLYMYQASLLNSTVIRWMKEL